MRRPRWTLAVAAPLLLLVCGAFDCPIALDEPTPKNKDGGTSATPAIIIGGNTPVYWTLTTTPFITVTAHGPKAVQTKVLQATTSGQVGDSFISLLSFCGLANAVCPHKVLPNPTAVAQYLSQPSTPVFGFNRTGPLALLKKAMGLLGTLSGNQLIISLATDHLSAAKADPCALGQASRISATVSGKGGKVIAAPAKGELIQGTIKLAYKSDCFTLSGQSVVPTGTRVELSVPFTASRR